MHDDAPTSTSVTERRSARSRERGSSTIEYVGLGSLATMLVTGIAAAVDSAAGDRVAAAVFRRLIAAVSGAE